MQIWLLKQLHVYCYSKKSLIFETGHIYSIKISYEVIFPVIFSNAMTHLHVPPSNTSACPIVHTCGQWDMHWLFLKSIKKCINHTPKSLINTININIMSVPLVSYCILIYRLWLISCNVAQSIWFKWEYHFQNYCDALLFKTLKYHLRP